MMGTLFWAIAQMSFSASIVVLALLLVRGMLKRMSHAMTFAAWALVAVRLVCPFAFRSPISLMPSFGEPTVQTVVGSQTTVEVPLVLPGAVTQTVTADAIAVDRVDLAGILTVLWLVGVAGMLTYTVVVYRHMYRQLCEAVHVQNNVYACDRIPTPFIVGIFRPRVYVPSSLAKEDMRYVLAHEQAHLERYDHWWKPLGFVFLTLHWFNPLMWVAYVLFCKDMETACDEKVIRRLGEQSKKPYSDALINCSMPGKRIAAGPLAFGETGVKARIRAVLCYRKPTAKKTAAAALICALIAVCFLTDPSVVAAVEPSVHQVVPTRPTVHKTPLVPVEPSVPLSYSYDLTIESVAPGAVKAGESVTVRAAVSDTRGLKSDVTALLYRETEDGDFITIGEAKPLTLVQGEAANGVYEGSFVIPAGTLCADYRVWVRYTPVSEKPAMCSAYTPAEQPAFTVVES